MIAARFRSLCFWGLIVGTLPILAAALLLGASGIGLPDLQTPAGLAVLKLRLGRVIAGFIVGAGLAGSGVVLQALLRNPLAEPYVLGVSSGAGLGAALAILTGLGAALGAVALPLFAFILACVTLALVYFLACRGADEPSVYGLILSGVIVSSICSSLLMFMISIAPLEGLHSILWWMLGNLQAASNNQLIVAGALTLFAFIGVWSLASQLNALTLGTEMAHHLGVRTRQIVRLGLVLATLMTAACVALSGLIGFVGLIVPHAMRSLLGPDHRRLLPAAALGGGLFLVICDAAARTILAPIEIPVGVITALLGGPFFLFILRRKRGPGWIG